MAATLEQARLAHKLGIAQRKSDGKFGYKLPCPVCGELMEGSCFCSEDLETAIRVKQAAKEAPYACSTECLLKWNAFWEGEGRGNLEEVFRETYHDETPVGIEFDELRDKVIAVLHLRVSKYGIVWPPSGKWVEMLRKRRPELYRKVIAWYDTNIEADADGEPYDDGDTAECSCEIDGDS